MVAVVPLPQLPAVTTLPRVLPENLETNSSRPYHSYRRIVTSLEVLRYNRSRTNTYAVPCGLDITHMFSDGGQPEIYNLNPNLDLSPGPRLNQTMNLMDAKLADDPLHLIGVGFLGMIVKYFFDQLLRIKRPESNGPKHSDLAAIRAELEQVNIRLGSIQGTVEGHGVRLAVLESHRVATGGD